MADENRQRTLTSSTCIAFVHCGNVVKLSCGEVCCAVLLNSSCRQIATGRLSWFGQNAINTRQYTVNTSSLRDDIYNGYDEHADAEAALKVTGVHQDVGSCNDCLHNENSRVQFATTMKVAVLKMNAHLAGCVTKALCLSSNFAHSFVSYARCCARKGVTVFPEHCFVFNVDTVSAAESCLDISGPTPLARSLLTTSAEDTVKRNIVVHHSVFIVMTRPRRLWIDYQWFVSSLLSRY